MPDLRTAPATAGSLRAVRLTPGGKRDGYFDQKLKSLRSRYPAHSPSWSCAAGVPVAAGLQRRPAARRWPRGDRRAITWAMLLCRAMISIRLRQRLEPRREPPQPRVITKSCCNVRGMRTSWVSPSPVTDELERLVLKLKNKHSTTVQAVENLAGVRCNAVLYLLICLVCEPYRYPRTTAHRSSEYL